MTTTIRRYKTNLRCGSCVAAIKPHLDREPEIERWEADVASPGKTLTDEGKASETTIQEAIGKAGYQVLGEVAEPPSPSFASPADSTSSTTTYYPLLLLAVFLVGIVTLVEVRTGGFLWDRAMGNFMGAFFLAFSFFKLLDLRGFADSYRNYDVVARQFHGYGYVYPFIELLLGVAYVTAFQPFATNLVTVFVMGISSIGVIQSLINKRKIRCACLGTVFNLPMSTVTLVEDGLMIGMATFALFTGGH